MDFISLGNIVIALIITLVLIICHLGTPFLSSRSWIKSDYFVSFSAGISAAYVFLHMLPSIVESNATIGSMLSHLGKLTPLLDIAVFLMSLFGFVIYYGLDIRLKSTPKGTGIFTSYNLAIGFYALFNFLVTYTMPLRVQTGVIYAITFTVAISLQYIIADIRLLEVYPDKYKTGSRLFLAGCLGLGWLISACTDPIHVVIVAWMVAFLSGAILYRVLGKQLSQNQPRQFSYFVLGIVLIAILLISQAWLKHH